MKKSVLIACLCLLPVFAFGQIWQPDGLRMPGTWNNWANDPGMGGDFELVKIQTGTPRWTTTFEYIGEGETEEFKFASGVDNPWQNAWGGWENISLNTVGTFYYKHGQNNSITLTPGNWYTVNWRDKGYENTEAIFMETSAEPVQIISVTNVPEMHVLENEPVSITVELDKALSPEEKIYIRYSTNDFQSSEVIEVTGFNGGVWAIAQIPGQPLNSKVEFYVLSTTVAAENWGDADMHTIRMNNNLGSNYHYFYEANIQPLNKTTETSLTPEFEWPALGEALEYHLQVSVNSDYSDPVIDETGLTETSYLVPSASPLQKNTTYYWRFKAEGDDWRDGFSFSTESEITFANLQFPENGTIKAGDSFTAYGRIEVPGVTSKPGVSANISVWLGFNSENTAPSTWDELNWMEAEFNPLATEGEEYMATESGMLAAGEYYYAFRYQYKANNYVYGGVGGIWDGLAHGSGYLVVTGKPELLTPANLSSGISKTVELTWQADGPAPTAGYTLQIAEDEIFDSIVLEETAVSGTTYGVAAGILAGGSEYYWRLKADFEDISSDWSDVYSFATAADVPAQVIPVYPQDDAENITLFPVFEWNSAQNALTYHLQASTTEDFDELILDAIEITETTFTPNSALANAETYFWRVRGVNGELNGNWSEAQSFSTLATVPELLLPEHEADNQPAELRFTWANIPDALTYEIRVSQNGAFSELFADSSGIADSTVNMMGFELEHTYFWSVRAHYAKGVSNWATARSFTIKGAAPLIPEVEFPKNNQINVPVVPELSWNTATDAELYEIQFADNADFTPLLMDSSLTQTSIAVGQLATNTLYYWRLRAYSQSGGYSDWGETLSFTTVPEAPEQVTLLAPAHQSAKLAIPFQFTWNESIGATAYEFQLADDSAFTFSADTLLSGNEFEAVALEPGTTSYWRVRAMNSGGGSPWSRIFTFTTGVGGFAGPALISPKNGVNDIGEIVKLQWQALHGAEKYHLQISVQADFTTPLVDADTLTQAQFTLLQPEKGISHYWRVRALDGEGESEWSEVYNFGTEVEAPAVPVVAAPLHEAAGVEVPVVFTWKPAARAQSYQFMLAEKPDFSVAIDSAGISDTTITLASLKKDTEYYWRVRAVNESGVSGWTSSQRFRTILQAPALPEMVYPEDGSDTELQIRFAWNEADFTETYAFQLSTTENFETFIVDSLVAQNFIDIGQLQEETTYYWRIKSINNSGESNWAAPWSFTTGLFTSTEAQQTPVDFALHQNYPNPFNPVTTIVYDVKQPAGVVLQIYDITGRLVQTLVESRHAAGTYTIQFDARHLASGIYIIRMQSGNFTATRNMTLIK